MRVIAGLAVVVVGCSSSGGGTGQPGGSFHVADMISAAVTTSDGAGDTNGSAWIVLASTSQLCSDAGASPPIDRKGQRFIAIQLLDVNGATSTTPVAPGTYTIYPNTGSQPPHEALLTTGGIDGSCQSIDADAAAGESGTVTLASISGNVFAGSYDVVLNTGDTITGTFAPEACPALETEVSSTAAHSCE